MELPIIYIYISDFHLYTPDSVSLARQLGKINLFYFLVCNCFNLSFSLLYSFFLSALFFLSLYFTLSFSLLYSSFLSALLIFLSALLFLSLCFTLSFSLLSPYKNVAHMLHTYLLSFCMFACWLHVCCTLATFIMHVCYIQKN